MPGNDGKFKSEHAENRHCEERSDEAIQLFPSFAPVSWIASLRSQ
jgi:hypothetical protein